MPDASPADNINPVSETDTFKCNFCDAAKSYACYTCGKRYCAEHGAVVTARCQECTDLEAFGNTYRFRLSDGRLVENIEAVNDMELRRLLEAYQIKVRALETLIESARKQQAVLRRRLKKQPEQAVMKDGKLSVPAARKTQSAGAKTISSELMEALSAVMLKDPEAVKKLLSDVKKDVKKTT